MTGGPNVTWQNCTLVSESQKKLGFYDWVQLHRLKLKGIIADGERFQIAVGHRIQCDRPTCLRIESKCILSLLRRVVEKIMVISIPFVA